VIRRRGTETPARPHGRDPAVDRAARTSPDPLTAGHPLARIVVALGASPGGTDALRQVIARLPTNMPGCVVVQHMPPGFTALFARSLDAASQMEVKEAADGDRVRPGRVLVAPGGRQMRMVRGPQGWQVNVREGPLVSGHRPSVDVLLRSVAETVGPDAIGAIFTGMGRDGAAGLLDLREAGATTLAQDEATSVVFGMPGAAWENGAAQRLVPLPDMAPALVAAVRERLRYARRC